jgi:hypothetical protein
MFIDIDEVESYIKMILNLPSDTFISFNLTHEKKPCIGVPVGPGSERRFYDYIGKPETITSVEFRGLGYKLGYEVDSKGAFFERLRVSCDCRTFDDFQAVDF